MKEEQDKLINALADEVYQIAADHGFHDEDSKKTTIGNYAIWVANLHDEVSELWTYVRKGKLNEQCDKKVDLTFEEEELADVIIRALDTAAARGIDIGRAIRLKSEYNQIRPFMHGKLC